MNKKGILPSEILQDIVQCTYRYSYAMDMRRWEVMDDVFLPDARIIMGEQVYASRVEGVAAIRRFIECCSQTHHMNSNTLVLDVVGPEVHTITNFRAFHRGRGPRAREVLECMGTYVDRFRKGTDGWRIAEREENSPVVIGDMVQFFSDVMPAMSAPG